ncbi:MAG: hypothetical protein JJU11_03170 [Candidatus Sumerlaeia bacterium]|nr:hypothetical protein [Candidatus Sumerlaeia bacterium]
MSRIDIQLETEAAVLQPGRNFSGKVRFTSEAPWRIRRADVSLFWRASNEKGKHQPPGHRIELCRAGGNVPTVAEYPFRLMAPVMPWSFKGVFCSIEWFLQVTVRPVGGRASNIQVGIVVAPPGYNHEFAGRGFDPGGSPGPMPPS